MLPKHTWKNVHMLNEKMKHITAIHIFNSDSLSAYYMAGIVLDTGNILCPHGAYLSWFEILYIY